MIRIGIPTPAALPCGCRLKNNRGSRICTNAVALPDRSMICRHGRRFRLTIGGFKEYPSVELLKSQF